MYKYLVSLGLGLSFTIMKRIELEKKRERFILRILIVSALIILASSIEALMMAKDVEIYREILKNNPGLGFDEYINSVVFNLFIRVLSPVVISLYTFFTVKKYGVNFSYKLFFGGMTLIEIVQLILQFRIGSIFYYIVIILNFILLFIIGREERV